MDGEEFVYLIEATGSGAIKVGAATNPRARLKALQTGCPVTLVLRQAFGCPPGKACQFENELHRKLDTYRIRGEWFREEAPLLKEMLASPGDKHRFGLS